MSFLQGVGIASQAGDYYDDLRAQRRMRTMQEEIARRGMMNQELMQHIYRRAIELAMGEEAAKKAKKGKAPKAPVAPGILAEPYGGFDQTAMGNFSMPGAIPYGMDWQTMGGFGQNQFKDGGVVKAPKFNGIYDAQKVKDGKLPNALRTMGKIMGSKKVHGMLADGQRAMMTKAMQQIAHFAHGGAVKKGKMPKLKAGGICQALAKGGLVRGPGTGTSDSIPAVIDGKHPARLSDGEYVIPRPVVDKYGVGFFDDLIGKRSEQPQTRPVPTPEGIVDRIDLPYQSTLGENLNDKSYSDYHWRHSRFGSVLPDPRTWVPGIPPEYGHWGNASEYLRKNPDVMRAIDTLDLRRELSRDIEEAEKQRRKLIKT